MNSFKGERGGGCTTPPQIPTVKISPQNPTFLAVSCTFRPALFNHPRTRTQRKPRRLQAAPERKGKKKTNTVNASRSSDDSTLRTHLRLEDKSWSWNLRRVLLSRRTWKIFASDSQPCVPRESVCAPRWLCALAEAAPSRWEKCV